MIGPINEFSDSYFKVVDARPRPLVPDQFRGLPHFQDQREVANWAGPALGPEHWFVEDSPLSLRRGDYLVSLVVTTGPRRKRPSALTDSPKWQLVGEAGFMNVSNHC